MRDYALFDGYLNELTMDVYDQPEDAGHMALAEEVIRRWMSSLSGCKTVLDVGAGTGFCQPMFEVWGCEYTGVALGNDVLMAKDANRNVLKMDFSFLDFPDKSFDLVFSRHSLEHSPFPLITLMEWRRVARNWLGLILPAPEHYGFGGRNHFSVMTQNQVDYVLERSGWRPIWKLVKTVGEEETPLEYWYFCEKKK